MEDQRQANVVLTADTSNYSQQMVASAQQTDKLTQSVNKLVVAMDSLVKRAGKKLEIISGATVATITAATLSAGKFEQQLATLNATSAVTGRSMNTLRDAVDSIRRNMPISTEQVASLVTALQKLGASNSNMQALAQTFVKLSKATGEDLGSLATNMVQLQRQMGTTEEATGKFASSVVSLSANLGVSANGVLQFAQSLAPMARQMGVTETQVLGISAAFVKAGQDGYAAANVFNKMMTDIAHAAQYGSNDIYAYANAVGMTVQQFQNLSASQQFLQFMQAVNAQGQDSIKTLTRLGFDGPRALKAIQGLAQSGGLNQALNTAQQGFNSDALNEGYKAATQGLSDAMEKLRNNMTSIGQLIGTSFLKPMTAATDALANMANAVRTLLGPINALLGALGLTGAAVSGIAGVGLSSVSTLATVGGVVALMRNRFTGGFLSARAAERGVTPSAWVQRSAEHLGDTRGFGAGVGLYTQMRRAGLMTPGDGGPRNILGRAAYGLSAIYQGATRMGVSALNPLMWGGDPGWQQHAQNRAADVMSDSNVRGLRENMSAAWGRVRNNPMVTGEGVSAGSALRGAARATVEFTAATAKATMGLTRLAAETIVPAGARGVASAAGGLLKSGASGLMGLMGGPWGLALAGGLTVANLVGSAQQGAASYRDNLTDNNATNAAVNKYATALGLAASATMSFAASVTKSENLMTGGTNITSSQARSVSANDIALAKTPGRQLTNSALANMNVSEATQYATSVFSVRGIDPQIQQAMKLDLLQRFKPEEVDQILANATKSNAVYDPTQLYRNATAGDQALGLIGKVGGNFTEGLTNLSDTTGTLNSYLNTTFGQKTSGGGTEVTKNTTASVNALLQQFNAIHSSTEDQRIASTIESLIGEGNLGFDAGDISALENADTLQQRQAVLKQILTRSAAKNGRGGQFLGNFNALSPQYQNATTYTIPGSDGTQDLYRRLGVYGTRAGAMIPGNPTIQNALAKPEDANAQLNSATQWAASVTKMAGSAMAAGASFQQIKEKIQDVNDPLYQMANAAQQASNRLQGYASMYYTPVQNQQAITQQFATAYAGTKSINPAQDATQNFITAQDTMEQSLGNYYQQMQSMTRTLNEYNKSRDRSQKQFNLQLDRGQEDYNISRTQQEYDFNLQRARSLESYNIQLMRGQQSYDISRTQAQQDYDKSRRRAEEDYNHQIQVMAKQTAMQIADIYKQITTKPTWDTQNLLTNSADQMKRMQQQQADLKTVQAMGLSGDVIQQLGLNSMDNQQQLARMVSDFQSNPQLIDQMNQAIKSRIQMGQTYATDPNSMQYQEMQYQFNTSQSRGAEDFQTSMARAQQAYEIGLAQMEQDYQRMTKQSDQDYKTMVDRQSESYSRSVARMTADFNTQLTNAQTDLNDSFTTITDSLSTMEDKALSSLTGTAKTQFEALAGSMKTARDVVTAAANGATDDIVKALAPLFGGEDAVRKALGLSIASTNPGSSGNATSRMGLGDFNYNPGSGGNPVSKMGVASAGGGFGSEQSYDSASAAFNGRGGGESVDFPLPAGTYRRTSGFGMRMNPILHRMMLHAGVDFGAKQGTPIGAAESGIITKAGNGGGLGNMVAISHPNGTQTWYGHMSQIEAKVGQSVSAGQEIGKVGSTGNSTGPHLHFELHVNGKAVDPTSFLAGAGVGAISGPGGTTIPDISALQNVVALEKAMSGMPGGAAYAPGTITKAVQAHLGAALGGTGVDTGGWFGNGAIFNKPRKIGVAERGAEALIPLNDKGADFMSNLLAKYALPENRYATGQPMQTINTTYNQRFDQSTNYTGEITVQSNDPDEFARKMEEKKRLKALTNARPKS